MPLQAFGYHSSPGMTIIRTSSYTDLTQVSVMAWWLGILWGVFSCALGFALLDLAELKV